MEEMDRKPLLDGIHQRPESVREFDRQERMAAFRQLLFAAGPILSAFAEMGENGDGQEREGPASDGLLTVKEAAAKLRVNPRTLYARVKSGEVPFALRDGRSIRISGRKLERWIEARTGR
jgi:excisionase family DNA binding protein